MTEAFAAIIFYIVFVSWMLSTEIDKLSESVGRLHERLDEIDDDVDTLYSCPCFQGDEIECECNSDEPVVCDFCQGFTEPVEDVK